MGGAKSSVITKGGHMASSQLTAFKATTANGDTLLSGTFLVGRVPFCRSQPRPAGG